MKIYQDKDCNRDLIKSLTVAVIGYGAQGHAHALNLRDSGVRVIVGLRENSPSAEKALKENLEVASLEDAARQADIVALLMPDEYQADVYRDVLAKNMKPGAALLFAHGLNIHFGLIKPRKDIDVVMVAPKGPGYGVRAEFVAGRGIPCLIAVAQDFSGKALEKTLSYACAIGGGRAAIIETTFKDECETDLFGEQAVLCGGAAELVKAGFDTLVEAGYAPEMAYIECLHELKLIADLMYQGGLAHMQKSISNTAEYGGYVSGKRVIDAATKQRMKDILSDIQSGKFVQEFMGGNKEGLQRLSDLRAQGAEHPIEDAGEKFRAMLPALKKSR